MKIVFLPGLVALAISHASPASSDPGAPLPGSLLDTGLYVAGSVGEVRPENIAFAPQYPLWSDGTTKRRWLYLPPGTAIDASRPDEWDFPRGTRAWKEFSHARRIETRLIERLADGSWRFAAYVWNAAGTDATLAPDEGVVVPVAGAPRGRYAIPSRTDCLACHEGTAVPLLGFSALQLSPERDPLAPHAEPRATEHADLRTLVARGQLRNLPRSLLENPPRIAAPDATARAALGYLHANCGHCHNAAGALAGADIRLAQKATAPEPVQFPAQELSRRLRSTNPIVRMPPLGVEVPDAAGIALVERWLHHDLRKQEPSP